jgi:hypothetical protein
MKDKEQILNLNKQDITSPLEAIVYFEWKAQKRKSEQTWKSKK